MKNASDHHQFTRRKFIRKVASAGALFSIVPGHVVSGLGHRAPSDKLNIACVGIGGRGWENIEGVNTENIYALCDVDWEMGTKAFKEYPKAARYRDFRSMLEKEKSIDAVVISTPDHTHAVVSMMAMKLGKHVYCEKPLTRTIKEARVLAETAEESGVATQMGNQGMAFEGNRQLKEWIADGAIGQVYEVHAWSDRPTRLGTTDLWWPQGIKRPMDTPPVPDYLDWDLWLGPASYRPYHPVYAPFNWRGWWDFGSGGLGDMGVHNLAPVFAALKLKAPVSVHSSSTPVFEESLPVASTVHYDFIGESGQNIKLHWYDGGLLPRRPDELEDKYELPDENGAIIKGDKGTILIRGWGGQDPRLIPDSKMEAYKQPPKTLPRSIGHYQEWIKACKTGSKTESNFEFAGPLTEALLLGTISVRLAGAKLNWDSKKMKVTNNKSANDYLHFSYREGWVL